MCSLVRKKRNDDNINFVFASLNKGKIAFCFILEAVLDLFYYIVPFSFTLFLTLPFTLEKAFLVVGIFVVSKVVHTLGNRVLHEFSDNYLYEYSNVQYREFYKKLTKLPAEVLMEHQTGYFENIIEKISVLVREIIQAEYVSILLTFGFLFYTLFGQSPLLFVLAVLTSIICITISIYILKKANKQVEDLYEQEYIYSSVYNDFISNVRTVKLLNHDSYFIKKIDREGKKCARENRKYVNYYALEEMVRDILIVLPFFLGLLKAVVDLSHGIDTIGLITFYISLQVEMGFVFEELSSTIISFYELSAIKKKIKKIFAHLDNRESVNLKENIVISDVVLSYSKSNLEIEVDDLIVHKGDKVSIMGKSGQGKTSFINLLLGNIENYRGNIEVDERSIRDVRLDIGVVSQEIELFNMSIRDNLCLDKHVDDEELISLLKVLELDEILNFEDGLNTVVGEKGLKLSTGQKRRINLLRSFLMNKDVYVLDEPTSNLDEHTEKVVVDFILKYFKDKTLVIVTHNERINAVCNKFYEFRNHKLVKKSEK